MKIRKVSPFQWAVVFVAVMLVSACWSPTGNSDRWKTVPASPSPSDAQNAKPTASAKVESPATDAKPGGFKANLPASFVDPTDEVGRKLLKEYGSLFVARGGATPPNAVVFKNAAEVSTFQNGVARSSSAIGGTTIELQDAAMKGLKDAVTEAQSAGAQITPRGSDSARRTYEDTVKLWASRIDPGLAHWQQAGRISAADASRIKALSPYEQVPEIFKLEDQGIFFAKDLSKSVIYSVAPPGTSQHLSMLALDVSENENANVRVILAKHGWFQTVVSDLPHFTFLGVAESDLPRLGLKKISSGGRTFWTPDL